MGTNKNQTGNASGSDHRADEKPKSRSTQRQQVGATEPQSSRGGKKTTTTKEAQREQRSAPNSPATTAAHGTRAGRPSQSSITPAPASSATQQQANNATLLGAAASEADRPAAKTSASENRARATTKPAGNLNDAMEAVRATQKPATKRTQLDRAATFKILPRGEPLPTGGALSLEKHPTAVQVQLSQCENAERAKQEQRKQSPEQVKRWIAIRSWQERENRRATVKAGDFQDCLDNNELQSTLSRILGDKMTDVLLFYDVRKQLVNPSDARQEIQKIVDEHAFSAVVTHTHNHWAIGVVTRQAAEKELQVTVYDSAASPITARVYAKIFGDMEITDVKVVKHAGQGRNECGLHTMLIALLLDAWGPGLIGRLKNAEKGSTALELEAWRQHVERAEREARRLTLRETAEQLPNVRQWLQERGLLPNWQQTPISQRCAKNGCPEMTPSSAKRGTCIYCAKCCPTSCAAHKRYGGAATSEQRGASGAKPKDDDDQNAGVRARASENEQPAANEAGGRSAPTEAASKTEPPAQPPPAAAVQQQIPPPAAQEARAESPAASAACTDQQQQQQHADKTLQKLRSERRIAPARQFTTSGAGPRRKRMETCQDQLAQQLMAGFFDCSDKQEEEHMRRRMSAIIAAASCSADQPMEAAAIDIAMTVLAQQASEESKHVDIWQVAAGIKLLTKNEVRVTNNNAQLTLITLLHDEHYVLACRNRQQPNILEILDSTNNKAFRREVEKMLTRVRDLWGIKEIRWPNVEQQGEHSRDCGLHVLKNAAKLLGDSTVWSRERVQNLCEQQYERYTHQHTIWCATEGMVRRDGPNKQPLTSDEVQQAITKLHVGPIRIDWINEAGDLQIWYGEAKRTRSSTIVNAAQFDKTVCGDRVCNMLTDEGEPAQTETMQLPYPNVTYVAIEQLQLTPQAGTVVVAQTNFTHRAPRAEHPHAAAREETDDEDNELANCDEELEKVMLGQGTMPVGISMTDPFPGSDDTTHVAQMKMGQLVDMLLQLRQQQPAATQRPTYISAFAWENLTESTRETHIKLLQALCENCDEEMRRMNIGPAVAKSLELRAAAKPGKRPWAYVTLLKNAVQTQAALASLPLYMPTTTEIRLQASATWRQTVKKYQKMAREQSMRNPPKSMTIEQHVAAFTRAPSTEVKAFLALAWRSCARYGDITGLHREDFSVNTDGRATLTFRRGKAVTWRGPYSVHLALDKSETAAVQQHIQERLTAKRKKLFSDDIASRAMKHLKTIDRDLTQRSSRRGALQYLARSMTAVQLMAYSGHTNVATLRRYLMWGAVATREIARGQDLQQRAIENNSDEDVSDDDDDQLYL